MPKRTNILFLLLMTALLLGCAEQMASIDNVSMNREEDSLSNLSLNVSSKIRHDELSRRPLDSLTNRELAELALLETRRNLTSDKVNWPAILSSIVALIALIITYLQGRKFIEHNKAMVRPNIRFDRRIARPGPAHILIINVGPGIAIIKDFYIRFKSGDGDEVIHPKDFHESLNFLYDCIEKLNFKKELEVNNISINTRVLVPPSNYPYGDSLQPGEEIVLLEIIKVPQDQQSKLKLRDLLSHISFEIKYTSVHGDKLFSTDK